MPSGKDDLIFQAAVERPLSAVFKTPSGTWEGHDYRVEVITERQGLDACDVVMDFRALEAVLDARLAPLQGCSLTDLGLSGPVDLAERLLAELAPHVPEPARLVEVALTDGRGKRVALRTR